jgi:hypothetical protein
MAQLHDRLRGVALNPDPSSDSQLVGEWRAQREKVNLQTGEGGLELFRIATALKHPDLRASLSEEARRLTRPSGVFPQDPEALFKEAQRVLMKPFRSHFSFDGCDLLGRGPRVVEDDVWDLVRLVLQMRRVVHYLRKNVPELGKGRPHFQLSGSYAPVVWNNLETRNFHLNLRMSSTLIEAQAAVTISWDHGELRARHYCDVNHPLRVQLDPEGGLFWMLSRDLSNVNGLRVRHHQSLKTRDIETRLRLEHQGKMIMGDHIKQWGPVATATVWIAEDPAASPDTAWLAGKMERAQAILHGRPYKLPLSPEDLEEDLARS